MLTSHPPIVHEQFVTTKETTESNSWDIPIHTIAKNHLMTMTDLELDDDWRLGDFFGTIAVINLPTATERLKGITEELQGIGVTTFEIFKGIDGRKDLDPSIWNKMYRNREKIDTSTEEGKLALDSVHKGEAGCYMSHYTLIKHIKDSFDSAMEELEAAKISQDSLSIKKSEDKVRQFSRVLILEDDAAFGVLKKKKVLKKDVGLQLRKALKTLPENWDMLYLLALPKTRIDKFSKFLYKLDRSVFAVAYAINHTMYAPLVERLKKIEDPNISQVLPVDNEMGEIHRFHNVFLISPAIVYHQKGVSEITTRYREKPWQRQLK
jgi:GR25 family glycosyltransferase involved in LPS biosynthesis